MIINRSFFSLIIPPTQWYLLAHKIYSDSVAIADVNRHLFKLFSSFQKSLECPHCKRIFARKQTVMSHIQNRVCLKKIKRPDQPPAVFSLIFNFGFTRILSSYVSFWSIVYYQFSFIGCKFRTSEAKFCERIEMSVLWEGVH